MNRSLWGFLAGSSLLLAAVGCGGPGDVPVEKLEQSFQNAPPNVKSEIDAAVKAIRADDFSAAAAALQKAVKPGGLTVEQKAAVSEVVAQMQVIASQKPEKYTSEQYRAIGEVIPIMEGEEPLRVLPDGTVEPP